MKKIIIPFLVLVLSGCNQFFVDKECVFQFIVFNKSKNEVKDIKLFLIEKNKDNTDSTSIPIQNLFLLKSNDSTKVFQIDLRKFSKGQSGIIALEATKNNKILKRQAWSYDNFNYANNSYPGFNTFEFYAFEKGNKYSELSSAFSRYNGNIRLEGGNVTQQ